MNMSEALGALLPVESVEVPEGSVGPRIAGFTSSAEAVVRPGSTAEVATLLSWANREGVGVLPTGPGTVRRRGFVRTDRTEPFVVLSTERLTGITVYEAADLTLTAGAGTPWREVDAALRAHAQWAPFDSPFVMDRSLGGIVVDGASGPLWAGYGEARNHVLGMTVVTGDGRTIELGGRVVKNVAGYDVLKAMVGSHGTLAVVTSVCVRAFPVPAEDRLLLMTAPDIRDLVDAAQRVCTAPVLPVSVVLVDELPGSPGLAALAVRLHGAPATVDADQAALERHLEERPARGDGESLEGALRDRAASGDVEVLASGRPSMLAEVVGSLMALEPDEMLVDCYASAARFGSARADAEAVRASRTTIEGAGGALRVVRWPHESGSVPDSTARSPQEITLTRRLRDVFDPGGVLWPNHR